MSSDTETADLSSSGPSAPGVSELAEVLGRHALTDSWWEECTEEWRTECGCNATFAAPGYEDDNVDEWEACAPYRRHVAEVIAASGVVVPAAEVREQVEALADDLSRRAVVAGQGSADRRRALHRAADDLRALLARLAGGGAGGGTDTR